MSAPGENAAAQIGARMVSARTEALDAKTAALKKSLKAQCRLAWGVFGLNTALMLFIIITLLFRDASR